MGVWGGAGAAEAGGCRIPLRLAGSGGSTQVQRAHPVSPDTRLFDSCPHR